MPPSGSLSVSEILVIILQKKFSENHDLNTGKILKSVDKFGLNMYTIEMTNAITPTRWFCNLYLHSQTETDSISLSDQEIVFPLESCASKLVLNIPIYVMIFEMLKLCNHAQPHTTKTLTFVKQSEVPIK